MKTKKNTGGRFKNDNETDSGLKLDEEGNPKGGANENQLTVRIITGL